MSEKLINKEYFPITINDTPDRIKLLKGEVGKTLSTYFENKKLDKYFISITDWEISDPYSDDVGDLGSSLILFSQDWSDDDKYSISKSLLLYDDNIWERGYKSATEIIMTTPDNPNIILTSRLASFSFMTEWNKDSLIFQNSITSEQNKDIKILYSFIKNIELDEQQKDDIKKNRLVLQEYTKNLFQTAKKQYKKNIREWRGSIVEEIFCDSKSSNKLKSIIESFDKELPKNIKNNQKIILWAFWRSLLYFYNVNSEYKRAEHIIFVTATVYNAIKKNIKY